MDLSERKPCSVSSTPRKELRVNRVNLSRTSAAIYKSEMVRKEGLSDTGLMGLGTGIRIADFQIEDGVALRRKRFRKVLNTCETDLLQVENVKVIRAGGGGISEALSSIGNLARIEKESIMVTRAVA